MAIKRLTKNVYFGHDHAGFGLIYLGDGIVGELGA